MIRTRRAALAQSVQRFSEKIMLNSRYDRTGASKRPPASGAPAALLANHAAPCRQALGRMLTHPFGELRRAHQAGLHRDVGEARGGDDLLVAIGRRGQTTEHGDDLDHERLLTPSPPLAALSCRSLTGSAGGKMLS